MNGTPYPIELTPRILFEDTHLAVIDKPAGLLSQGERTGDRNLVDWLRVHFGRNYVGLVHRLDRNTSGVLVVAKRTKSAQRLTESLQQDRLRRRYLAWLTGTLPAGESVRWRHHLLKDEARNLVRAVRPGTPGAKSAELMAVGRVTARWRGLELTLTELVLETGRSHQIRAQAAAERHPLLGDRKYLGTGAPAAAGEFPRTALHSWTIEFPHPMGGETMAFSASLPADLRELVPGLELEKLIGTPSAHA
jgi:23S rRNA pseudouridine1911/1915/1917 synthase